MSAAEILTTTMDMLKLAGETAGPAKVVFEAIKAGKDAFTKQSPGDGKASPQAADAFARLAQVSALIAQQAQFALQENSQLKQDNASLREQVRTLTHQNDATQARVRELEEEAGKRQRFEEDKSAYVSRLVGPHSHAYVKQSEADARRPTSMYCHPCFDDGKVSLLQLEDRKFNFDILKCPRCERSIQAENDNHMVVYSARSKRSDWFDF